MTIGSFPDTRLRRNRKSSQIRDLLSENNLSNSDFIMPFFVMEDSNKVETVNNTPHFYRFSIEKLIDEIKEVYDLGIKSIILFPVVEKDKKSFLAEESYNENNIICRAVRTIKDKIPDITIITDVALDPYTNHGHDGIISEYKNNYVLNDESIEILCKQALVHVKSGCDIIAPSDMMDGRVKKIRNFLDNNNFTNTNIASYSVKYASNLYYPFREAMKSQRSDNKIDKRNYQMDCRNVKEAMLEVESDIKEGADIVIIKPANFYSDVIHKISSNFYIPVISYQVSGEYMMLKLLSQNYHIKFNDLLLESLISLKRAGSSSIITYGAKEICESI